MKQLPLGLRVVVLGVLVLVVFACEAATPTHVVLISIDGAAAYHLDDESLLLPNIRALAATGVRAKGSEPPFPSLTHPAHTTLITGVMPVKHGVLANDLATRVPGKKIPANTLPRSKAILSRTLFDAAKEIGLTTASLHWPETVADPAIDHNLIAADNGRKLIETPFVEELRAAGLPVNRYNEWRQDRNSLLLDHLTTDAALYLITRHRPRFLAIHFFNTDSQQHQYGPKHYMARAALTQTDAQIGRIIHAVKAAGAFERTLFVIAADHGFATVRQERNLRPYFAAEGLADKVQLSEEGWTPFLQLLPTFEEATDRPKLQRAFARFPADVVVHPSSSYHSIGLPSYEESDRVPGPYLFASGINTYLVWSSDGQTSVRRRAQPVHAHGYFGSAPEMHAMMIFSGPGIRPGAPLGVVHHRDIALTIGAILGASLPSADGRVLREILESRSP